MRKKIITFLMMITLLCSAFVGCNFAMDGTNAAVSLTQLSAPVITEVKNDVISWNSVANASSYVVRINTSEQTTTSCSFNVASLISENTTCVIKVKAKGNGIMFSDSEWSEEKTYVYKQKEIKGNNFEPSLATSYGLGYGYNVIEDEYFSLSSVSQYAVLDMNKAAKELYYNTRNTTSSTGGTTIAETIEEASLDISLKLGYSSSASAKYDIFSASVQNSFEIDSGIYAKGYSRHYYYNTFSIFNGKDRFIQYNDPIQLSSLLSKGFLADLKGESNYTRGKSYDEIAEFLYDKYGTHLVTGITTGGRLSCSYVVFTETSDIKTRLKTHLDTKVGAGISGLVDASDSSSFDESIETAMHSESSYTSFTARTYGGGSYAMNTLELLANNIGKWHESLEDDSRTGVIGTMPNGLCPLYELIPDDYENCYDLRQAMMKYYDNKGETVYKNMLDKFADDRELPEYDVNYNTMGGEPIETKKVSWNGLAEDVAPTRKGYDFIGWYEDAKYERLFDFNKRVIKADTTLYAKWKSKDFNVCFVTYNGNNINKTVNESSSFKVQPLDYVEKNGYVFGGYYKDVTFNEEFDFSQPIYGDTYIYLKWNKNPKVTTVYINSIYNTVIKTNEEFVTYGNNYQKPIDSTLTGYSLVKYCADDSLQVEYDFARKLTVDTVIYAVYKPNECTVKFVTNEGSPISDKTVYYGDYLNAGDYLTERAGHYFCGWFKDISLTQEFNFYSEKIEKNITLYAKWSEMAQIEITFKVFGEVKGKISSLPNVDIEATRLPAVSEKGYLFNGWYLDEDFKNKVVFPTSFDSSKVLFAQMIANGYDIEFNKNKPSQASAEVKGSMTTQSATFDIKLTLSDCAFTLEGWVFEGWSKEANGKKEFDNKAEVINLTSEGNGKVTLYAVWSAIPYNIIFNANGANGIMSTISCYYDCGTIKLSKNEFYKQGYNFEGWALTEKGNVEYLDEAEVENLSNDGTDITLYAVWKVKISNITYDLCNTTILTTPSISNSKQTIIFDKDENLYVPTAEHYNFIGWYKEINYKTKVTDEKGKIIPENKMLIYNSNCILYAKWAKVVDAIYVSSVSELKAVSGSNNYLLVKDLNLEGKSWVPLNSFSGTFNGGYHKIYNFNIIQGQEDPSDNSVLNIGLFSYVTETATISNLQIGCNGYTTTINLTYDKDNPFNDRFLGYKHSFNAGMIVGYCAGKIENCCVVNASMDLFVSSNNYKSIYCNAGGVCGVLRLGMVSRCSTCNSTIKTDSIVQYDRNNGISRSGGIVGFGADCKVYDCLSKNNIIDSHSNAWGGTVIFNETGKPDARSGGIVGSLVKESSSPEIKNCVAISNDVVSKIDWGAGVHSGGVAQKGFMIGETSGTGSSNLVGIDTKDLNASGSNSNYGDTIIIENDNYDKLIEAKSLFNNGYWTKNSDGTIALKFK